MATTKGRNADSLFRLNKTTTEKFKCNAITEAEEKRKKEHEALLEEINRRTCESGYGV
jgi:hypothetical protein